MVLLKYGKFKPVLGSVSSTTRISRRGCCCCWKVYPRAGLLCFLGIISLSSLLCTNGRILVYSTSGGVPTTYEDIPSDASLGPPIPPDFRGFLSLSEPRDACLPIQLTPHPSFDMGDGIFNKLVVLVERSHPDAKIKCTFEEKVLNAQKARGIYIGIQAYPPSAHPPNLVITGALLLTGRLATTVAAVVASIPITLTRQLVQLLALLIACKAPALLLSPLASHMANHLPPFFFLSYLLC